jgi:hypothetical protein
MFQVSETFAGHHGWPRGSQRRPDSTVDRPISLTTECIVGAYDKASLRHGNQIDSICIW